MNSSYFIIGGFFAEQLNYQLEKKINKSGVLFQFPTDYDNPQNYMYDLVNKLSDRTGCETVDYLILELRSLLDLIDPDCFDEFRLYEQIDGLIDVTARLLNPSDIIIIKSNIPKYFIQDDVILKEIEKKTEKTANLNLLNKIEKYIQKKTGGVLINTTSYYFFQKKRGYALNNRLYEKECYLDISIKIVNYFNKGNSIKSLPDTRISLNRYIKYGNKTILFNALQIFLNPEEPFFSFVMSCSNDFVDKHKKDFLRLKKIEYKDFISWQDEVKRVFSHDPLFYNITIAFYSLFFDLYDETISYSELFQQKIVSQKTIKDIQKYVTQNGSASPNQINRHNAGYYFALMNGYSSEEALHFVAPDTVIKPELVDVFGSCLCRTCFRECYSGNTTLAANNYWFQMPPFSFMQPKISYDPLLFSDLSGVHNNCAKLQFEHKVSESIMQSNASWILIDNYGSYANATYEYKGFYYTDFSGEASRKLGTKRVRAFDNPYSFGDENKLFESLDIWCDTLLKKYHDQIIFMCFNYLPYTKGDDNIVYCPRKKEKFDRMNILQNKAYEYAKKKLNCYCIEISNEFCPDDRGFTKRSAGHYSYDYYAQAYNQIDYIIKNKPEKKIYDTTDPEIRLKRLADYVEKNDNNTVRMFFKWPLDQVIMNLPSFVIRDNINLIASWYQNGFESLENILEGWQPEWDSSLKTRLLEQDRILRENTKAIIKDYIEEPVLKKNYLFENTIPIIGHRGYAGKYPQNSMVAFYEAYNHDFDGIELDLWESYNGDLIIAHDESMQRLFGVDESIRSMTAVNRFLYPQIFGKGIKKYDRKLVAPTLEEVLSLFSSTEFLLYLNIRSAKGEGLSIDKNCAERIISLIRKYDMTERTCVFSTQDGVLELFYNKGVHIGRLTGKKELSKLKKIVKKLTDLKGDTLILTETDILREKSIGTDFLNACHKKGIKVGSFNTQTVEEYKYLCSIGADFSMADFQLTELMEKESEKMKNNHPADEKQETREANL